MVLATLYLDTSMKWVLVITGVILLAMLLGRMSRPEPKRQGFPFEQGLALLNLFEIDFFHILREAADASWYIACKPQLSEIITVRENADHRRVHLEQLESERVDFLLCDAETMAPLLAIELVDPASDRQDVRDRTAFLSRALRAARLPLLEVSIADSVDVEEVRAQIREKLA